ncbi:hypothetical protein LTS18_014122, partial [Coniosporium uncinatum]
MAAKLQKRIEFFNFAAEKVDKRLATKTDRPDFMTYILRNQDEGGKDGGPTMSRAEMHSTIGLFLIAGSETTATMLSGTTYLLLTNPDKMQKLKDEIRGKFKSEDEITIDEVSRLPYLLAVLNEGLRIYPPVPTGFPRVVPAGGDVVSGYYLPEGTSAYVSQHATNHSPRNFTDPDSFVPERWLAPSSSSPDSTSMIDRYAADKKSAFQPFSFGPRNCLGKNLAYAEMRLIMAKTVWNFDMALAEGSEEWMERQKVFALWEKGPLE